MDPLFSDFELSSRNSVRRNQNEDAVRRREQNVFKRRDIQHRHLMAAELEKRKLIKAQEFGYDSTWSEVEQILDEQYKSQYIRPCMLQNRSFNQFKKINLYKKIQMRYGVIGLLIIHNMLSDP